MKSPLIEIKNMDVELASNYDKAVSDPKFFDHYQAKKKNLEALMAEWELVQEELELLS